MKYRKKPVVIDAIQYLKREDFDKIKDFVGSSKVGIHPMLTPSLEVSTLEGVMIASVNDWIIKGVNGEFYPCKPDIFEKTYEKVDDN